MKNNKKNIYLVIISVIASIILVLLNINSEYPNGLGMERAHYDYAWFGVYIYTSSTFLVAATMILILSCKNIHDLNHAEKIKEAIKKNIHTNIKQKYLLKTWLSSFFLYPVFLILTYVICFFIFPARGVGINLTTDGPMYNSLIILLRACIITIIYSIFVFNVTLIVSKKIKSFAVTAIFSFMIILIYAVISQSVFSNLLKTIFQERFANGFDLINGLIFGFGSTASILIHGLILVIITTLILNKIHKNNSNIIQ